MHLKRQNLKRARKSYKREVRSWRVAVAYIIITFLQPSCNLTAASKNVTIIFLYLHSFCRCIFWSGESELTLLCELGFHFKLTAWIARGLSRCQLDQWAGRRQQIIKWGGWNVVVYLQYAATFIHFYANKGRQVMLTLYDSNSAKKVMAICL